MTTLEHKKDSGFVALITAIILSFILILVTTTLSQSSFLTRSILLDSEYKERSAALAEACVDVAKLKLANNSGYSVINYDVAVGSGSCRIDAVVNQTPPNYHTIRTSASSTMEAVTKLEIILEASDLSIYSWEEI